MGARASREEVREVHLKSLKSHHAKFIAAMMDEGEDTVLQALEDGKLLADFSVFLRKHQMWWQLIDLWKLDVVQSLPLHDLVNCQDEARRIVTSLSDAWQAYQKDPDGKGNFEDAQAWAELDMPDPPSADAGKKDKKSVDSQNDLYTFAIAAMVGIHVSTVCNDILLKGLGEASKMTGVNPADEFQKTFSNLPAEECLKRSIREFRIPRDGTAYSPKVGHVLGEDFVFEEMSPQLFAGIRRLSQVSNEEYFNSMCRTDFEFIAFGSNSKSGEAFFFSHDKKFLLKTTTEIEASTLMSMLAEYESHLAAFPSTFLGRYLGLYRLKIQGNTKLFFVMRSVSDPDSGQKISKSFDIKGSTRNRLAPDSDSVGKDLNFDKEVGQLDLLPEVAAQIVATHRADCELLRRYSIMDFSFLIQIYHVEGTLCAQNGSNKSKSMESHPGVKLKQGSAQRSQWFNPKDSTFIGLDLMAKVHDIQLEIDDDEKVDIDVKWSPNKGIQSKDGRFTYFFGLIDMLVPYGLYPKAQYVGTHLVACVKCKCDADGMSRIPSNKYCDRQRAKVTKICGL
jgi:hypothetical protein